MIDPYPYPIKLNNYHKEPFVLLYLDLNCFNRPFDDQNQIRVARETDAIFKILQRIVNGLDTLAWSAILDFENSQHPLLDRRTEIAHWELRAIVNISVSQQVSSHAEQLTRMGLDALDAAHLACAEIANCDRFLTCDDKFTRRARRMGVMLQILNPVEYIKEHIDD